MCEGVNVPNHELTRTFRYATMIKTASYSKRKKSNFINNNLNAFGQVQGGPTGSMTKISNSFI